MGATVQSRSRGPSADPLAGLDFYRLFAACFGEPSPARFAWLSGRDFRALIRQLADDFEVESTSLAYIGFRDYVTYESSYLALFEVGVPEPPVPLLESAHSPRAVPQEIVLECVNFYEVLGLRPSGSAFPADHLVTQLEFLAAVCYLRQNKRDHEELAVLKRLEADFLERHLLSWLPSALKKLCVLNPPLFPSLLELLYGYSRRQFASIAACL